MTLQQYSPTLFFFSPLFSLSFLFPARTASIITGQSTVNEGDLVVLTCSHDGEPAKAFKWLKDGGSIPVDVNVSTPSILSIASVEHSKHAGVYQCNVELENGSNVSSNLFQLTVNCKECTFVYCTIIFKLVHYSSSFSYSNIFAIPCIILYTTSYNLFSDVHPLKITYVGIGCGPVTDRCSSVVD